MPAWAAGRTSSTLSSLCVQTNTECTSHLQDGCEARVSVCAERFVKTFSAQASIACDLSHAFGASNITQCSGNASGIIRSLNEPSIQVRGHFFRRA